MFVGLFVPFFFFLHSFSLHLFVSRKSLNDEERGGNCLLVPERSCGPDIIRAVCRDFSALELYRQ